MADPESNGFVRINGNGACSVVIDPEASILDCQDALNERHSKLVAVLVALTADDHFRCLPEEGFAALLGLARDLAIEADALSKYMWPATKEKCHEPPQKEPNDNPVKQRVCVPAELGVGEGTHEDLLTEHLRQAEALANAVMIQTFADGRLNKLRSKDISEGEAELFFMMFNRLHDARVIAADMFGYPQPEPQSTL